MTDQQEGTSHQKTGRRPLYVLGAATIILGVACAGLCGYLIYEKVKPETGYTEPLFKCPRNAQEIQEKFRGIFFSAEDGQKMQKRGIEFYLLVVNGSNGMTNLTFPFNGSTTTTALYQTGSQIDHLGYCRKTPPNSLYHCCCSSWNKLEAPDILRSAEPGQNGYVIIYQTTDYKQYFTITTCCQIQSCQQNCQCMLRHQQTTAVVVVPDTKGTICQFQLVRVPNCCNCVNF